MQLKLKPPAVIGICVLGLLLVLTLGYRFLVFNPNATANTSDLNVNLVIEKEMTNPKSLTPAQQSFYESLSADQKNSALAYIHKNIPAEQMSHPIAFNGAGSGGYRPYGNGAPSQ